MYNAEFPVWLQTYLSCEILGYSVSQVFCRPICPSLQELNDIRSSGIKIFRDIQVDESNILYWQGLIVPVGISILYNTTVNS